MESTFATRFNRFLSERLHVFQGPTGSAAHLQLDVGLSAGGVRELNEARWSDALAKALRDSGRTESDLEPTPQPAPWKIEVAATLRREAAAPFGWIARKLKVGNLNTLRSKVRRSRQLHPALA